MGAVRTIALSRVYRLPSQIRWPLNVRNIVEEEFLELSLDTVVRFGSLERDVKPRKPNAGTASIAYSSPMNVLCLFRSRSLRAAHFAKQHALNSDPEPQGQRVEICAVACLFAFLRKAIGMMAGRTNIADCKIQFGFTKANSSNIHFGRTYASAMK